MSDLFARVTGLSLIDPGYLWLVLLLPALLRWRRRRGDPAVLFPPQAFLKSPLPRSWRVALLPLPRLLGLLGLLLTLVALARPVQSVRLPVHSEGIDILLCLDTSSSMTDHDMDRERTRLAIARDAAATFIRGRPDDRIGLISFARYADVRCPPTLDHDALTSILAGVETVGGDSPEDATGLGGAVARAAQVLGQSRSASKVVILLTDGEENVALRGNEGEIAPAHAAQLCQRLGIRVYAIVAGEGRRNATGAFVKLDSRPVEDLARRTGGAFLQARDAGSVDAVYEQIDALERAPIESPRFGIEDQYLPFLLAALVLLLLARLLASTILEVLP